jgi:hypothetical protein
MRGDCSAMPVAQALKTHFAKSPETARSVPDISWLKRQPLITDSPGFRD